MKPPKELKRLLHESEITTGPEADERILHDALNELEKRRRDKQAPLDAVLWRALMKNKMIRFGTAFVVIIAAVIAFQFLGNPFGTKLTFANAIEPILNADTVTYDIVSSLDGFGPYDGSTSVTHYAVAGSRRRSTKDSGLTEITDIENGRVRALVLYNKAAEYYHFEGEDVPSFLNQNFLDDLKNRILILKDDPDYTVKELGRKQLNGKEVDGFFARYPKVDPYIDITIWADVDTKLPVCIETNTETKEGQIRDVMKNIKFDIPLEEDLFSMEVPAGYTVWDAKNLDFQAAETKFIEGLRLIAERFNHGFFPDGVSIVDYQKWMNDDYSNQLAAMNLPKEEADTLYYKLFESSIFIRFFRGEMTYRCKGVRLGETETPIFWYKPENSKTYRVIYGDLHVEDVYPENLPK